MKILQRYLAGEIVRASVFVLAAFLALAPAIPVRTTTVAYPLERANDALDDLRAGRFEGAAVIQVAARPG